VAEANFKFEMAVGLVYFTYLMLLVYYRKRLQMM
jgi:hypothetical protein